MPASLSGFLRLVVTGDITWGTISASEVAITAAFICLLVSQSVGRHERPLDTEFERNQTTIWSFVFLLVGSFVLVIFTAVVILETQALESPVTELREHHNDALHSMQLVSYGMLPVVGFLAYRTQRNFGLKASFS